MLVRAGHIRKLTTRGMKAILAWGREGEGGRNDTSKEQHVTSQTNDSRHCNILFASHSHSHLSDSSDHSITCTLALVLSLPLLSMDHELRHLRQELRMMLHHGVVHSLSIILRERETLSIQVRSSIRTCELSSTKRVRRMVSSHSLSTIIDHFASSSLHPPADRPAISPPRAS